MSLMSARIEYLDSSESLVDYRFKPQLRTLGRRFGRH